MTARLARWAPVALYMGLIFFVSAQPALPQAVEHVWDKARHAVGYAGLAVLWVWALSDRLRQPVTAGMLVLAWVLTSAYGASDEWHQSFVPPRQADVADWLADSIGATAAVLMAVAWSRWHAATGYNRSRNGL